MHFRCFSISEQSPWKVLKRCPLLKERAGARQDVQMQGWRWDWLTIQSPFSLPISPNSLGHKNDKLKWPPCQHHLLLQYHVHLGNLLNILSMLCAFILDPLECRRWEKLKSCGKTSSWPRNWWQQYHCLWWHHPLWHESCKSLPRVLGRLDSIMVCWNPLSNARKMVFQKWGMEGWKWIWNG